MTPVYFSLTNYLFANSIMQNSSSSDLMERISANQLAKHHFDLYVFRNRL